LLSQNKVKTTSKVDGKSRGKAEGKVMRENESVLLVLSVCDGEIILEKGEILSEKRQRFELSPDQVKRIADRDLRVKSGIAATEVELTANPYIIAESDQGTNNSVPVAIETIDHGMLPEGDAALFADEDRVPQDDRRRVRALAYAILQDAADNGDTVLTFSELLDRITKRFPERRACLPDREVITAEGDFHREVLWTAFDEDPQLVALKRLQSLEQHIVSVVKRRAKRTNASPANPLLWRAALENLFGRPTNERESEALDEKEVALGTLFTQRLSILTGGAGTGKTSVLKVSSTSWRELRVRILSCCWRQLGKHACACRRGRSGTR
jgi:exodeoxyribonuclease V alpha subunit